MAYSDGSRECVVSKKEDEEFEFFLRVDDDREGQIITSLTPGGPAERCGLKDGDRVLEVNGVSVEKTSHNDVVELIRESMPHHEIKFRVVDKENDPKANKAKTNSTSSSNNVELRPRICKISKKRNTFGFTLEAQGTANPGHFIKDVADGGPAVESGLRSGDRIIEVGGANVEKIKHEKVVSQIKKSGGKVTLLVVDDATYKHFMARKLKIKAKHAYSSSDVVSDSRSTSTSSSSSLKKATTASVSSSVSAVPSSDEEKARLVHVCKEKNRGYGFFLRVKNNEQGEYIGDLETGKSGEKCGLRNNDRVIAVNGEVIIDKEHEEVVGIIKSNPQHTIFLVLGPKALTKARSSGLLSAMDGAKEVFVEKPRVVKLDKSENGYGFFLKMNKGSPMHSIADIEEGSAAGIAGLKNGEVLACIDGNDVMRATHTDCVSKIKEAGSSVELTIASRETMDIFYALDIAVTSEFLDSWPDQSLLKIPNLSQYSLESEAPAADREEEPAADEHRSLRICKLTQIDGGFGFFLRDEDGHLLGSIETGGAADKAGVKENDEIIEINGSNVEKETHTEVVERIRNSGAEVTFLVVNEDEKKYFKSRNIAIASVAMAATAIAANDDGDDDGEAPLPRLCKLNKDSTGFGFHLNGDSGDRPGQYINQIMNDGPADRAGIKDGDRVIEVNGVNIKNKIHDDVVKLIVSSGSQVSFLVVDEEADRYYIRKGVEITAAMLAAAKVADVVEANIDVDRHSSSSSIIEAEATVHLDPDTELDKTVPPEVDFPPPPLEEKVEEVTNMIDDAIDELREQEHDSEEREEMKEELEEVAEELREEVGEQFAEEIREEVREAAIEEAKEEILDEIKDQIKDDIRDEIVEDLKEDIAVAAVAAAAVEVAENIQEAREEQAEEERKEELERIKAEVMEEQKRKEEEEERERVKEELRLEMERQREEEERLRREEEEQRRREEEEERERERVKEQLRKEMEEKRAEEEREAERQRIKEELRKEVEREMQLEREKEQQASVLAPPPPPPAPVPMIKETTPSPVIKRSPVANTPPASAAAQESNPPTQDDLQKMASSLKSVKRRFNVTPQEDKKEEAVKPVVVGKLRERMAMFEQSAAPAAKPGWRKTSTKTSDEPKSPTKTTMNGDVKSPKSWAPPKMTFNIVETSAIFN